MRLNRELITANYKYKAQVQAIYDSARTANQKGCYVDQLLAVSKKYPVKQYAYILNGQVIAVFNEFICKDFVSFCNFAVAPKFRNKGYGTKIVNQFLNKYKNKTIIVDLEALELEAPDLKTRERRFKFYYKFKLHLIPYLIVRPRGVVTLMSNKKSVDAVKYWSIIKPFWQECHKQKLKLLHK